MVSTSWYYGREPSGIRHPEPIHGLVTIAGGTGTGKTSVGGNIAEILTAFGFPTIAISSGFIYRLLAFLALTAATSSKAATSFTDQELVAFAKARRVRLVNGRIWMDDASVSEEELRQTAVNDIVTRWGNDPATTAFAGELIRAQIRDYKGIVVLEGRSVNGDYREEAGLGRFWFEITPERAASRTGKPVIKIVNRNQADEDSGALPKRPIGWYIEVDDLDVDAVSTYIVRWMIEGGVPGLGQNLVGVEPLAR